jgi:hypothetical protein
MYWIIQEDLWHEAAQFAALLTALDRQGVAHAVVKVVPSSDELLPEPQIPVGEHVYVCGAITMQRIARTRGWVPGAFMNESFDFEVWREHYGSDLLNADALVGKIESLVLPTSAAWDAVFVRPVQDSKEFDGQPMERSTFEAWRQGRSGAGPALTGGALHPRGQIVVASAKSILSEYRFFVVDRQIVTGSIYRLGGRATFQAHVIDEGIMAFAQQIVIRWQPATAFVLDVALTPDGPKVVEINCINSAGFYRCDVAKLVAALEAMEGNSCRPQSPADCS